ncbi:MAG TPA: hypothetical protein VEU72_01125 [Nitrosopumilaceae archaeon]|nr:hypothetical protein [Nitrosopumilaceae archaeon]
MSKNEIISCEQIDSDLIICTVEKHLIINGNSLYNKIIEELSINGYTLDNCYMTPEILANVLKKYFGIRSHDIMLSIEKDLRKGTSSKTINGFLDKLCSSFYLTINLLRQHGVVGY